VQACTSHTISTLANAFSTSFRVYHTKEAVGETLLQNAWSLPNCIYVASRAPHLDPCSCVAWWLALKEACAHSFNRVQNAAYFMPDGGLGIGAMMTAIASVTRDSLRCLLRLEHVLLHGRLQPLADVHTFPSCLFRFGCGQE
jgi:hypothetical protein